MYAAKMTSESFTENFIYELRQFPILLGNASSEMAIVGLNVVQPISASLLHKRAYCA
jgi:hypothetical protein